MLKDLRLVRLANARLDVKPRWVCKFTLNGQNKSIDVPCSGDHRPLGRDLLTVMSGFLKRRQVTEASLLNILIVE